MVPAHRFRQKLASAGVMIGSDGSVQEHRASFAWVMSDREGNRMARCNGPVFGLKPVSYQAEGYGILSVLRLMHHMRHKWAINCKFKLWSNNKTMVNRTNEGRYNSGHTKLNLGLQV